MTLLHSPLFAITVLTLCGGEPAGQLASDRMSYPGALSGRYEPRRDLPAWMNAPRWCTTDAPRWGEGQTAALIDGHADRHANVLRLGMFWGGLAHFPSEFAPRSPSLRDGVDPLAEAIATVRKRNMHILAYINPNAWRQRNPLYDTACIINEDGEPWDVRAYGIEGTRYACINHPAFAEFYVRAIRELVGRYGADGIYVDGLSPHVCYCEHCRKRFRKDTGRDLPPGLSKLGPLTVLWEMTSDWDVVPTGDPQNPDHVLYSRWLMKNLADLTRLFSETTRAARPGAVIVFHTWPKPDIMDDYDGTLNEIYARRPWHHTLWKRAEFSNWGDVFAVPSLVNIYLRQHPWGAEERRPVTSEVEARHMYWQTLANGGYPNSWGYPGMERPFKVMRDHADLFEFPATLPTRFLALPRPMFTDSRHRRVGAAMRVPLRPGTQARLRISEREPNGRIDLLCLRADGQAPSEDEYHRHAAGERAPNVIYLNAADFDPAASTNRANGRAWTVHDDPDALSGRHIVSRGHQLAHEPQMPLEYPLPEIASPGPWELWARVIFPNTGSDSFFWQVSNDGGATWHPGTPVDECALGWEQPQTFGCVKARAALHSATGVQVDRFLSPPAGMFAGLLHAGLPVKQMHPNHITAASLEGFQVLVLANEVCLSDAQCAAIREFVRAGGGLVATHETSLYDLEARPRGDFGVADVFGARLTGRIMPQEGQRLVSTGAGPDLALDLPNREEHLAVTAEGATVAARLTGPHVPEGGVPALLLHEYGQGRVAYLPGRADSSYSLWADGQFAALAAYAVEWAARGNVPARASTPDGLVGITLFDQPRRNRRLIHLVSYNAPWVEAFDEMAPLKNVRVVVRPPEGRDIASARAVLAGRELKLSPADAGMQMVLPVLDEYEVIELKWRE
ncbi:MAG: DUF6259 domain-containing protein [Thermoguttaceae bacterium]|jgi:hypothetical protein|nr:DUF6259 domain-containing protein [Thermoguttaceae bacterium]